MRMMAKLTSSSPLFSWSVFLIVFAGPLALANKVVMPAGAALSLVSPALFALTAHAAPIIPIHNLDEEEFDFGGSDAINSIKEERTSNIKAKSGSIPLAVVQREASKVPKILNFFGISEETWAEQRNIPLVHFCIKFGTEICAAIAFLFVMTSLMTGRKANQNIASAWVNSCRSVLEHNFAQVGYKTTYLYTKGWNSYSFIASGRTHCTSLKGMLELRPRSCFWRNNVLQMVNPEKDICHLEIAMDKLDCLNFLLCRRGDVTEAREAHLDVSALGKMRPVEGLPDCFVVYAETAEAVTFLLQSKVLKALSACKSTIKKIYISDVYDPESAEELLSLTSRKDSAVLHVDLLIPPIGSMDDMQPALNLVFSLIDLAYLLQFSEKTRQSVQKNRAEISRIIQRAASTAVDGTETQDVKKIERKKAEDTRYEAMRPEERRKYDEKRLKREMKNSMPKIKMMKG